MSQVKRTRVFSLKPKFIELVHDLAHHFVYIGDHVLVVTVAVFGFWVLAVRSGAERIMGKNHGIVSEEGAVLIAFDKIAKVICDHIGPIFSIIVVLWLSVYFHLWVRVTGILIVWCSCWSGVLPEAGLIKPEVLGGIDLLAQLPLPTMQVA